MRLILAFLAVIIMHSCSKDDSFSCEAAYRFEEVNYGKNYGDILLNDTNSNWLNYDLHGRNVSFINDQGFKLNYWEKGYYYNDEHEIRKYKTGEIKQCVGTVYKKDFYNSQFEILEYTPIGDGSIFNFERYLNLKWDTLKADSFILTSKSESLYFIDKKTNGWDYYYNTIIDTDTVSTSQNQKFYSNLKLRNKNFKSVFELINTKVDASTITTKGYYYSFAEGLIGYYLTDKELWLKE